MALEESGGGGWQSCRAAEDAGAVVGGGDEVVLDAVVAASVFWLALRLLGSGSSGSLWRSVAWGGSCHRGGGADMSGSDRRRVCRRSTARGTKLRPEGGY